MRTRRPASNSDLGFFAELRQQRWDDHRLYHHSRINQSLHLVSALSFLTSYALLIFEPGMAAIVGWIFAMCTRQSGHFFFEPDGYDEINQLTHEQKEDFKVGYNLRRKVILLSIWAATPLLLWLKPDLFGLFAPHANWDQYIDNLAVLWLGLGVAGLMVRTVQLFFIRSVQTGLVWATKILTDPFHDVKLYFRSPFYLLRGQLIDPMDDVREELEAADTFAEVLDEPEPLTEN
jgi:hypothetical protein